MHNHAIYMVFLSQKIQNISACINHISAFRTLLLGMDNTETQLICEEEVQVYASLAAQPTPPKTDPAAVTSSEKPGKEVEVEAGP